MIWRRVQGLASDDGDTQNQALSDINDLCDIDDVNFVTEAVLNINNLLVGDPSVGYQSLITYLIQGSQLATDAYWSKPPSGALDTTPDVDAPVASFYDTFMTAQLKKHGNAAPRFGGTPRRRWQQPRLDGLGVHAHDLLPEGHLWRLPQQELAVRVGVPYL